ncbi:SUMO1 sentrin specific peptidase 1 [Podila epigama]|nr:SUMO1 sentrin specific peptidase 1 [Podila epigama]
MTQKRKTFVEPKHSAVDLDSFEEYSKKAKVLVSAGLSTLFNKLDPLSLYQSRLNGKGKAPLQDKRKRLDWVGAYPLFSSFQSSWPNTTKEQELDEEQYRSSGDYGRQGSRHRSTPSLSSLSSESAKPYQLKPYTKLPSSIASASQLKSRTQLPWQTSSGHGSSTRALASTSSSDESGNESSRSHHSQHYQPVWSTSRFNHPSDRYQQDSLLRIRPRIYASKAQKTTSLLQSKYTKEDSLARQRFLDRHYQSTTKSAQDRLKAALDATIGVLRTDTVRTNVKTEKTDDDEGDVTDNTRVRVYGRPRTDSDEETTERTHIQKRPAWFRAKKPITEKEPTWLQNLRNLLAKNLPTVAEIKKDVPNYNDIVSEHERIDQELSVQLGSSQELMKPLTKEQEKQVQNALSDGYGQVVEGFNVSIMKKDIHTLRPGEWLNDEVINFYGQLIMARSKETPNLPKVHVFSTFFYKTLSESGYDKVRRWTKKILRDYLQKESLDKLKTPFDFEGWESLCPKNIPQQQNGFDCGVFTCMFIESKSRGMTKFDFSQQHMPLLRKKMVLSIINKKL